jgi:hypothetical protein
MRCNKWYRHIALRWLMLALLLLPHALVGWHVATVHHHATCCQTFKTDGQTVQTHEDDCPICNFRFIRDAEKPIEVNGKCSNNAVEFIGSITYTKWISEQHDANGARGPPIC